MNILDFQEPDAPKDASAYYLSCAKALNRLGRLIIFATVLFILSSNSLFALFRLSFSTVIDLIWRELYAIGVLGLPIVLGVLLLRLSKTYYLLADEASDENISRLIKLDMLIAITFAAWLALFVGLVFNFVSLH